MRYTFEDFALDLDRRELRRGSDLIAVEPKVFDLLVHLIAHREKVVSKDELITSIWQGRVISETALSSCINSVRVALGDSGTAQRLIKTLPRKGVRFVGVAREAPDAEHEPARSSTAPLRLPGKPSIAVLPFSNLSSDPEQDYFADGVVEEITTALSRFSNLFVIARNSSFTYKGRSVDAKQIGLELGVHYLLGGSFRKDGKRLRLTGQLIDAVSGVHLWAERFDGAIADVFDLQDQITAWAVGAIMPTLSRAEIERAVHKPTDILNAYDYYMRGIARNAEDTETTNSDALALFRKAINLDPGYAVAYGSAAMCYEGRLRNGWMADRPVEIGEATRLARRAADLGKHDATALSLAGFVLARVAGDLEDGRAFIDQSTALNVNLARAWQHSGWVRVWWGDPETAIAHAMRAIRLSPMDPWLCSMQTTIAFAHFFIGAHDDASSWAAQALRGRPDFKPGLRIAAASSALTGKMKSARDAIAKLRALNPTLRLSNLRDRSATQRLPEFSEKYDDAMRKAGLPE